MLQQKPENGDFKGPPQGQGCSGIGISLVCQEETQLNKVPVVSPCCDKYKEQKIQSKIRFRRKKIKTKAQQKNLVWLLLVLPSTAPKPPM